ncbi:MAG: hypothetical protein L0211_04040 [Planctomycetaceae bacterium]|nr:hypothetical protein [Planctomycetaceae bacterium]
MTSDLDEIVFTLEQLRRELEDLGARGLRAVGPQRLSKLGVIREELERIGAAHVAGQLSTLVKAIENDDRSAAAALLRAQTSLRVFERLLTLETAAAQLPAIVSPVEFVEDDDEDEQNEEEP